MSCIFSVSLPSTIELLLYYTASLSLGLAVLNVIPCFMLDGQHIARVLVEAFFRSFDKRLKSIILLSLTIVGTLLIVLNIIFGLLRLLL
jgi:membrane-associated protease RseP (regulator of RpoE activity)